MYVQLITLSTPLSLHVHYLLHYYSKWVLQYFYCVSFSSKFRIWTSNLLHHSTPRTLYLYMHTYIFLCMYSIVLLMPENVWQDNAAAPWKQQHMLLPTRHLHLHSDLFHFTRSFAPIKVLFPVQHLQQKLKYKWWVVWTWFKWWIARYQQLWSDGPVTVWRTGNMGTKT